MKLTTKILKNIIKEELSRLYEDSQEAKCRDLYEALPWNIKDLVDRFKDSGDRFAVNDLYAAGHGDEDLKSYYPNYSNEELVAASDFLQTWFQECKDVGPAFDIEEFLGDEEWIAYDENIDDIEENLKWFLNNEEIDLDELGMSFEQLVELIRKEAEKGYPDI